MKNKTSQKGQALVLIALGMVGLIALAALAIDGGRVYSDRRQAQNAADTAALAAAFAKTQGQTDFENLAYLRATSNGYDNNGTSNEVEVNNPPVSGTYAGNTDYIQVIITSNVNTTFARVLGRAQLTNIVEAIAKAKLSVTKSWFDGKAMVSTMTGCGGGGTPNPFTVGGNGTTVINNSGIFVNSSCSPAFFDNGNSNLVTTDEGVCVVGGIQSGVNGVSPVPQGGCGTQVDLSEYQSPDPSSYCATAGSITGSGGNYEAFPGYFDKTGNKTFPDANPSGTLKLHKGVYCLYNGLSLNANWDITTDLNGNGTHDPDSEGVLFYVPGGDVTFNGGSSLNVHAISAGLPSDLLNYLFIVPASNNSDVTITGGNNSQFTGTIFAPASDCTVNGSGNTFSLDTQIICYDNTITGGGTIDITFNAGNNAIASIPPNIQLTK